jgi:hypothetical protein
MGRTASPKPQADEDVSATVAASLHEAESRRVNALTIQPEIVNVWPVLRIKRGWRWVLFEGMYLVWAQFQVFHAVMPALHMIA